MKITTEQLFSYREENRETWSSLKKIIPILMLFLLPFVKVNAQNIFINEFQASNSLILDEYGESDDWVELYNAESMPVDIGGMYISDDLGDPMAWQIPDDEPELTTIPANGYLMLWFDKTPDQGPLHINSKLSASGEAIGLFTTDGLSVLDSISFGEQTTNVSMGRESDGGMPWMFFTTPSPNDSNANGNFQLQVATPIASITGGHKSAASTVALSISTAGATIRYTTDGSEPTATSPTYNTPLLIDATTSLRARGFKTDFAPSRTMTHTYLYDVDHDFPIICLSTAPENFFDTITGVYGNWMADIEQPLHVEFYELNGDLAFKLDAGIKIHGSGSASHEQKGLDIIARSEYGTKYIEYPVFPDLSYDKYRAFILRASGNDSDGTLFRDAMMSSLVRETADVDGTIKKIQFEPQAYRRSIVYLNGEYFGIHNMREKLDWRYLERRHNVDKDEVDIITWEKTIERGNRQSKRKYLEFLETTNFSGPENIDSLKSWIDIDHVLDYHIFNVFVDNTDWPANNNKHWRVRKDDKKWRWFVYDLDFGFGFQPLPPNEDDNGNWTSNSLGELLSDSSTLHTYQPYATMPMRRLMENEGIKTQFCNRMADHLNIFYNTDRVVERVDAFKGIYEPEMAQHIIRFPDLNNWEVNVDRVRNFGLNRTETVWNMFENHFPEITDVIDLSLDASPTQGGQIRLSTMRLGASEFPWSGKYFAGLNVPIEARAARGYVFDSWSLASLGTDPVTSINFSNAESIVANFSQGSTETGNIVINEINYNSLGETNSGDWIELYNAGSTDLDLSAWYFEDESGEYFNIPVGTILPAGGYLVLVEDALAFQAAYPTVTNFVGNFGESLFGSFKLNNDSEEIKISNANASFVDIVDYDDSLPWPEAADGDGETLQLIAADLDNALPASWKASTPTPGAMNNVTVNTNNPFGENIYTKVTPNPFKESTTFETTGLTNQRLNFRLYDLMGRLVHEQNFETTTFEFQRNFLAKGVYFFEVNVNGNRVSTGKLVAE